MKVIIMNMCMIHDEKNNKVVVLDKEKKKGWEGLTFPGGHVELGESIYDSCIREVYEETGLRVDNLSLKGIVHWENTNDRLKEIGFLYYTNNFSGVLSASCDEGRLKWFDLEDFIKAPGKSDSMDDMLKVYMDEDLSEAMAFVNDGNLDFKFY